MALQTFLDECERLTAEATRAFADAASPAALEEARIEFLGAKGGRMKAVQGLLGSIPPADKPVAGKRLNETKSAVQIAFDQAKERHAGSSSAKSAEFFDVTLPGMRPRLGKLHPITQTIEELKDIMGRLGFTAAEGPEIEDDRHNFEGLNIPPEHPARHPRDNFYLVGDESAGLPPLLMRSQTSTVQIRVMESTPPPVRIISLGRVYRPDEADPTHYPMFHQMEGLWVDEKVTMADLKSVLRLFAQSYLGAETDVRFRPSFFPFTEPSVEVDYLWNDRWIEFGGAGMVDPNVFRAVGYDPEQVTGFAFGLGVERLCMRRHRIADIRDLFANDVRFLSQF